MQMAWKITQMPDARTRGQFIKYVLAGGIANLIGYGLYLLITWGGLGHKTTMTLLFFVGILISFWLNRNWAFGGVISAPGVLSRFIAAYLLGFAYNFLLLWVMVDVMGFDHTIIQAIAVATLALLLFMAQKYWIFRPQST
jgi:putative flippase GtrA